MRFAQKTHLAEDAGGTVAGPDHEGEAGDD